MINTSGKACGRNKATIDYRVSSLNDMLNDMKYVACSVVKKESPKLGTLLLKLFKVLIDH